MVAPRIVPRDQHSLSRRDIDPDALKVLYRLRQFEHIAYLVGGSVRDLLLGRRPKDFDIGTSAHPQQVKKLFRNCWIIGRRFRLAHVKFGQKVIEVATFRRQIVPGEEIVADGVPAPDPSTPEGEHLIHHDNTFGTPEEDAFRRDFTVNALFYDIATFSIIDYVGGLADLRDRIVRSIGDPDVRLREDPVRMLRAMALAARLDFSIEPTLYDAIRTHRQEIAKASPPRMVEEYYKILRAGSSEQAFHALAEVGLLEPTAPELQRSAGPALWQALARLDTYRRQFESTPDTLTNAVLLGSVLVSTALLEKAHPILYIDKHCPDVNEQIICGNDFFVDRSLFLRQTRFYCVVHNFAVLFHEIYVLKRLLHGVRDVFQLLKLFKGGNQHFVAGNMYEFLRDFILLADDFLRTEQRSFFLLYLLWLSRSARRSHLESLLLL